MELWILLKAFSDVKLDKKLFSLKTYGLMGPLFSLLVGHMVPFDSLREVTVAYDVIMRWLYREHVSSKFRKIGALMGKIRVTCVTTQEGLDSALKILSSHSIKRSPYFIIKFNIYKT